MSLAGDELAAAAGDGKGTPKVVHALAAGEQGLGIGGARPAQRVQDGAADLAGERQGDFLRLVEMAFPQARAVEWHGHEWPCALKGRREAGIGEGGFREGAEFLGEVDFAAVFETVDEVERAIVAQQGGSGEFEGKRKPGAVRALEGTLDFPEKRLAAGFAEGMGDGWQILPTLCAEGVAVIQGAAAKRTKRRIKQVQHPGSRPFPERCLMRCGAPFRHREWG